jgi:hypothetical protein
MSRYRTPVACSLTLFHMLMVAVPVPWIAIDAAKKMSARINPYSTAVAALVDRNSAFIFVIVPLHQRV